MKYGVLAILLGALLTVTIERNALWRDDGTIWADSLAKTRKARGYNELGLHLLAIGNSEGAYRTFAHSLALNAYQPTVYINLGIALERLNRIPEAISAYERAIRFQPDDPAPYYNAGILYYNVLHDRQKALSYLLKAKDIDPREPDVHQYLGRIYQEAGNMEAARTEIELYRYLNQ